MKMFFKTMLYAFGFLTLFWCARLFWGVMFTKGLHVWINVEKEKYAETAVTIDRMSRGCK